MNKLVYFRPGTVFYHKDFYFEDNNTSKDKFFVCLSYEKHELILATIITSNNQCTRFSDYLMIKAGENCFENNSYHFYYDSYIKIEGSSIKEFSGPAIQEKFNQNKIEVKGYLKLSYIFELVKRIGRSQTIQQYKIHEIMHDYNKFCKDMGYKELISFVD